MEEATRSGAAPAAFPARIGPFEILGLLGEGGMGRVYLARQSEPQREVALKVIAGATLSQEFARRFQREIELLAALEHPGIARLYQAGTADTASGAVPYLAMEVVRGSDLLAHAREARLDLPAKLRLLAQVCHAVHFAHTRGVIHRDLKPANILVDAHGEPRILDFGVAHVVGGAESAQMTRAGEVLGTLPYMPLEQLGGTTRAVDPRWDVYALGVIAYELLSGSLPYPGLSQATMLSALQEVRAAAPVRLSRHLPAARGDVETIVMKAMAAEPAQRYGSAAELAADLERYLQRQPIQARAPTVRYVLSLFVRRHKALAGAGAVTALVLVVATAVSLGFAAVAQRRLAENQALVGFLEDAFTSASPEAARGKDLTVRELLDGARANLETREDRLPAAVATSLRRTLGVTYMNLGRNTEALGLLERAWAQRRSLDGDHADETRATLVNYAAALNEAGRYPEAETLLTQALDAWPAPGPRAAREAHAAHLAARSERAQSIASQGRLKDAIVELEALLAESEQRLGATDHETLTVLYLLANAHINQADLAKALPLAQQLVERRTAANGPEHPRTLYARMLPATILFNQDDYAGASSAYRALYEDQRRVLGEDQAGTLLTALNLCTVLASTKDQAVYGEAAGYCRHALDHYKRQLEPGHNKILAALGTLSYIEQGRRNYGEAERLLRDALERVAHAASKGHAQNSSLRSNLGNLLMEQGRLKEALPEFRLAVREARATLGNDHPFGGMYALNEGECLRRLGRYDEAERILQESLVLLRAKLGATHPRVVIGEERLRRARARDDSAQLAAS